MGCNSASSMPVSKCFILTFFFLWGGGGHTSIPSNLMQLRGVWIRLREDYSAFWFRVRHKGHCHKSPKQRGLNLEEGIRNQFECLVLIVFNG